MFKCVDENNTHIPDNLIVIYRRPINILEDHVIRWCKNCGAIVIDIDSDYRTNPGEVMKMKFPKYEGKEKCKTDL